MAGDEGLEPSYLDLETSVLAAGRISRKLEPLCGRLPAGEILSEVEGSGGANGS